MLTGSDLDIIVRRARPWFPPERRAAQDSGGPCRGREEAPAGALPEQAPEGALVDIGVAGGVIRAIGDLSGRRAKQEVDAAGRLVTPGFVDIHMHWDKALTWRATGGAASLADAVRLTSLERLAVDAEARAEELARQLISQGTTVARTHVTVAEGPGGLALLEALARVRRRLAGSFKLELVSLPSARRLSVSALRKLSERALAAGADVAGGAPVLTEDPRGSIDALLEVARAHGVPLDLHVDESDRASDFCLEYLAEEVKRAGCQGRVVAGHCSALSLQPGETRRRVANLLREAGITVVAMPYTNLYLLGRSLDQVAGGAAGAAGRGLAPVRELLAAGVNVATASDNIQDAFCPYGKGDMVDVCRLLGVAAQFGLPREIEKLLDLATYAPARALGLGERYGLAPGAVADLVVHRASTPHELLAHCPPRAYVIQGGSLQLFC